MAFKCSRVVEHYYTKALRRGALHVQPIVDAFNLTPAAPEEPIDLAVKAQIETAPPATPSRSTIGPSPWPTGW